MHYRASTVYVFNNVVSCIPILPTIRMYQAYYKRNEKQERKKNRLIKNKG